MTQDNNEKQSSNEQQKSEKQKAFNKMALLAMAIKEVEECEKEDKPSDNE